MWIASFDIGIKNFAFCVEKINLEMFESIQNIPLKYRYNDDNTCTKQFSEILNQVYVNGEIILIDNVDLSFGLVDSNNKYNCNKNGLDPKIYINMNKVLDKYKEYWDKCSIIIIEQQMNNNKKRNPKACKLEQHCFSYFIFNYGLFKQIIEYNSIYKTRILGALKNISKYNRKKWAIKKALDILLKRNDTDTLKLINLRKKKDDLSDVIIQLQSFKYQVFVDNQV